MVRFDAELRDREKIGSRCSRSRRCSLVVRLRSNNLGTKANSKGQIESCDQATPLATLAESGYSEIDPKDLHKAQAPSSSFPLDIAQHPSKPSTTPRQHQRKTRELLIDSLIFLVPLRLGHYLPVCRLPHIHDTYGRLDRRHRQGSGHKEQWLSLIHI